MKLKTLFVLASIILLVFFIYLTTLDRKVYYLNIGDQIAVNEEDTYGKYIVNYLESKRKLEKYVSEFSMTDYRTTDLIRDIIDNRKVYSNGSNISLKNALIKADLVTLSIGMNDIYYKIATSKPKETYEYMDQILVDIENLLELIREYCKEDIIMLNYYNAYHVDYDEVFQYMNDKLGDLAKLYHIHLVDINPIITNKTIENRLPDSSEYQVISKEIEKIVEQNLFH